MSQESSNEKTRSPMIRIWSKARFSAAHRLHSTALTDEANRKVYGRCVQMHGHNYTVKVTLKGPIDACTGYVYSMERLDEHLKKVTDALDHRDISDVICDGRTVACTVEHICVYCWERLLASGLPEQLLFEVRVDESEKIGARYRGANERSFP